jgi:Ca2+-binding EF-hand superfamily protein
MKNIQFPAILTLLLILLSLAVFSQKSDRSKEMEKVARKAYKLLLEETDKNKDGKISKAEFFAIWKDKKIAEEKFIFWDTNKDGYITEEEYVKAVGSITTKKR